MPGTQQPYAPFCVEPDWMRLPVGGQTMPAPNTVKHGQRVKPRQNDLGLCGDESGQLTENASHFRSISRSATLIELFSSTSSRGSRNTVTPLAETSWTIPGTLPRMSASHRDDIPALPRRKYCSCRMSS